jgi:hypothetical protein
MTSMSEQGKRPDERRLRRAAVTAASGQAPGPTDSPEEDPDVSAARIRRAERQAQWADFQVRQAMARGDFDNLPGAGKPIRGLGGTHDPQWWVKGLIEREQITGVGPPALALRKEDAALDARLDRESTEDAVRGVVEDFNHRVVQARRQLLGGPPVITPTRDVDDEVAAWRARRAERRQEQRRQRASVTPDPPGRERASRRARWWRRGRSGPQG